MNEHYGATPILNTYYETLLILQEARMVSNIPHAVIGASNPHYAFITMWPNRMMNEENLISDLDEVDQ